MVHQGQKFIQPFSLHWLATMAITFVIRQLHKYGEDTDWELVKADADARIRDLVPGEMFDDFCAAFLLKVIDLCAAFLKDEENMKEIAMELAEGKFQEAIDTLMAWLKANLDF